MSIRKLLLAFTAFAAIALVLACGGEGESAATQTPGSSPVVSDLFSFSCAQTPRATDADASAFPLSVKDSAGRQVSLDAPPSAIVSLSAGHTEMLYAIGAGGQVSAADSYSDCPAAAADLPHLDAFSPSVESIVALEPDLVIIFFDPGGLVDALTSAGVRAIVLEAPDSVDGVFAQMELLGKATGHPAEAADAVTAMRGSIRTITGEIAGITSAPAVFHEVDSTYFTAGPGSFIADLYATLKARNIADATGEAYPQMSAEAVIAADPQVIILADEDAGESPETVAKRPGWSGIAAVKDGRVYVIDPDIVSRPGPRLVEALQTLARFLYPELFE